MSELYAWTKEEADVIKRAWRTDEGRIALNLVVERLCGLMSPTFDPNPAVMTHREGRRSVGVDLMRAINTPLDNLVKEPHEPREHRPITATERAERAAAKQSAS